MRFLLVLPVLYLALRMYVRAKPRRRPPAAKVHDAAWAKLGPARRAEYGRSHPRVCVRSGHRRTRTRKGWTPAQLHHEVYVPGHTGRESDDTFVWLCGPCHRLVHRRHDMLFPFDRWPYHWLRWVTNLTVRTGRWKWGLIRRLPVWSPS